jgi:hypothetical protein
VVDHMNGCGGIASLPQGLKPQIFMIANGMAKAMPYTKPF